MDFGAALLRLKAGLKVYRKGWLFVGTWIHLQRPDSGSKMGAPYLYMHVATTGVLVPWIPGQVDLLAEDWDTLLE